MSSSKVKKELQAFADPKQAKLLARFFKTGKGEYGEGDVFIGIKVPNQRKVAKNNKDLSLTEIEKLLSSDIHEHRLTALLILTYQFPKLNEDEQKKVVEFYLSHTKYINNWDLVDLSAPNIPGEYLFNNKDKRKILYRLAKSKNLWEKRIAMLSTFTFIREEEFEDALAIAELLVNDSHDLIHKAVGWMLRELGKKDQKIEEEFLRRHHKTMPRTMLRYAIERFDEKKRKFYMQK